jgi:hypothetical protein
MNTQDVLAIARKMRLRYAIQNARGYYWNAQAKRFVSELDGSYTTYSSYAKAEKSAARLINSGQLIDSVVPDPAALRALFN